MFSTGLATRASLSVKRKMVGSSTRRPRHPLQRVIEVIRRMWLSLFKQGLAREETEEPTETPSRMWLNDLSVFGQRENCGLRLKCCSGNITTLAIASSHFTHACLSCTARAQSLLPNVIHTPNISCYLLYTRFCFHPTVISGNSQKCVR